MATNEDIVAFLSPYSEKVVSDALLVRNLLFARLPGIVEQIDLPAKMIGYCYGQKYAELICMLIPSQKGLKLGFNRGSSLPDPDKLLQGTGKISRYVEIEGEEEINSPQLKRLLAAALEAYKTRK